MKGRLLALSSAAVLTVYAAGYARTRSAAEMLEAEERRPQMPRPGSHDRTPIPATPGNPALVPASPGATATAAPVPPAATAASGAAAQESSASARRASEATPETRAAQAIADAVAKGSPAAAQGALAAAQRDAAAPAPVSQIASAASSAADTSSAASRAMQPAQTAQASDASHASQTASPAPQAAQPVVTAQTAPAQPAQIAQAVPVAQIAKAEGGAPAQSEGLGAQAALAKWKDGKYTGWGTCRHGDLQATVQIENGRIVTASISQCLTRYPCDWIKPLPPQVVQRQSAETDYVSGATESTNAFYYAVLQALGKASQ
jgi:uncharacterized protein with FMN-binding domain